MEDKEYTYHETPATAQPDATHWYAVNVYRNRVFALRDELQDICEETYIPCHMGCSHDNKRPRLRPLVSRLMFVRCGESEVLRLETEHLGNPRLTPFRVYRNISRTRPAAVTDEEMSVLRLLATSGEGGVEIYLQRQGDYLSGDLVRVIGGPFKGAEGRLRRIRNNRRVVVELPCGLSLLLPFLPKVFLEKI